MTLNVQDWPLRWRRAFLLTLPVSVPLWLAAACVFLAGCLLLLAVLHPICMVEALWKKRMDE